MLNRCVSGFPSALLDSTRYLDVMRLNVLLHYVHLLLTNCPLLGGWTGRMLGHFLWKQMKIAAAQGFLHSQTDIMRFFFITLADEWPNGLYFHKINLTPRRKYKFVLQLICIINLVQLIKGTINTCTNWGQLRLSICVINHKNKGGREWLLCGTLGDVGRWLLGAPRRCWHQVCNFWSLERVYGGARAWPRPEQQMEGAETFLSKPQTVDTAWGRGGMKLAGGGVQVDGCLSMPEYGCTLDVMFLKYMVYDAVHVVSLWVLLCKCKWNGTECTLGLSKSV